MTENTQTQPITAVETENKLMSFWATNSKKITTAVAVLAIVIGGFFAYKTLVAAPAETKASEALFHAESYFRQDSIKLALEGDKLYPGFLKIISKYKGTDAANLAHYYAGSCYMKLGDFNKAISHLKDFSTGSTQIEARAISLMGDAYSELGKKEDAVAAYKKAGTLFEKDEYNSPEYLFRAGYLYESMGKNKEAIEMYKIIKQKYPRSERGFTIDKYLARLGEISE